MRRLPPLTAIEAFVQVARLGSIKAASADLSLSSPALSRRVQALERFIGQPLFERRHQALRLNAVGEQLLQRLAPVLDALADAVDARGNAVEIMRFRLGTLSLYASQRLIGRMGELRRRHPDLHIDIDTAPHLLARLDEDLDAVVALTRSIDPALYSRKIEDCRVVPIASRALLEGPDAIRTPEDLARVTILLHRDIPETFQAWREAIGKPLLEPRAIDQFDSGQLMLDLAAQGLGVAFMLDNHLEDARDPRLVSLFDYPVESPYSYWFACRRSALTKKPIRLFHDWLFETAPLSSAPAERAA
jgi:LysR family transcriptional regulator, glycine cleavage system transcriptional activator